MIMSIKSSGELEGVSWFKKKKKTRQTWMIFVHTRLYTCVANWRAHYFGLNLSKNQNKLVNRITYMTPGIYEKRKKGAYPEKE